MGTDDAWEVDALDPLRLQTLILDEIDLLRDPVLWAAANEQMLQGRAALRDLAEHWGQ